MTYLDPASFRKSTIQPWTVGLDLTQAEASDAVLTAWISDMSARFDNWTDDHFESETLTLKVNGQGLPNLFLPKRVQTVTAVRTKDVNGLLTTEDAGAYRVASSISGSNVSLRGIDYLQIIPPPEMVPGTGWASEDFPWYPGVRWILAGKVLASGASVWPKGPQTVEIDGTFSWPVTPNRVKRAVALLVWDEVKTLNDVVRRSSSVATPDTTYNFTQGDYSSIPEVESAVKEFQRSAMVTV